MCMYVNNAFVITNTYVGIYLALRGFNNDIYHTHLKNITKTVVPRTNKQTQTNKQTNKTQTNKKILHVYIG